MITFNSQSDMNIATKYFDEHLSQGDYYEQNNISPGIWLGKGCDRLGINSDKVNRDEFINLINNLHPYTGEKLTLRNKSKRREKIKNKDGSITEKTVANRRAFLEFTLSPPKEISVVALLGDDNRLQSWHQEAVNEAVIELEKLACVRTRKNGENSNRQTNEITAAVFTHHTARPVEGQIDPHLHSHIVLMNCSYDKEEKVWKALEPGLMMKNKTFIEQVYYNSFCRKALNGGYQIEEIDGNRQFQFIGMATGIKEQFCKRHEQIKGHAETLIENGSFKNTPEGRKQAEKAAAVAIREKKILPADWEGLKQDWRRQLTQEQIQSIEKITKNAINSDENVRSEKADFYELAKEHIFTNKSVCTDHELLREALKFGRGKADLDQLKKQLSKDHLIRFEEYVTTGEILKQEHHLINRVNNGVNKYESFGISEGVMSLKNTSDDKTRPIFSDEQVNAIKGILDSKDFITAIQGGAGVGKTTLLKEIVLRLNKNSFGLAPTARAASAMKDAGINEVYTIAKFLVDKSLQEECKNKVAIIDEVGMGSVKQLDQLSEALLLINSRAIAVGDTQQLQPIEAGDAFRILQNESKMQTFFVNQSQRQKNERYKNLVNKVRAGQIDEALTLLEENNSLSIAHSADRKEMVADSYLKDSENTLAMSPTWHEVHETNAEIRKKLKLQNKIGSEDKEFSVIEPIHCTPAQQKQLHFYKEGQILTCIKKTKNFNKNETYTIVKRELNQFLCKDNYGNKLKVSLRDLQNCQLGKSRVIKVSSGDKLLLKYNDKTDTGEKLINGEIVKIKNLTESGIKLEDGRIIPPRYKHFLQGYATTVHAAQGATVDKAIFSGDQINKENFYVAVSRGRFECEVYTSSKENLALGAKTSGERMAAVELQKKVVNSRANVFKRMKLMKQKMIANVFRKLNRFSAYYQNRLRGVKLIKQVQKI